jgi:hypothetical protein
MREGGGRGGGCESRVGGGTAWEAMRVGAVVHRATMGLQLLVGCAQERVEARQRADEETLV